MPGNMMRASRILCPFYRNQDKLNIGCEAPFEGPTLQLRFQNQSEKDRQRGIFCENQYKRCEIYRCIMANRYPEEDRG